MCEAICVILKINKMWKSWGDKFEIRSYDPLKRPRKVKNVNRYILILAIVCLLSMILVDVVIKPDGCFYAYIPTIAAACSVVVCVGLFLLKWWRNDEEYDLALILVSLVFVWMAYIAYP